MPDVTTASVTPEKGNAAGYQLNSEELGLPCAKLNGRIQMRILAVRHANPQAETSTVAKSMRSTANSVGMWSDSATTIEQSAARDYAIANAYNDRLAQLGCPQFDLKKEIAVTAPNQIPAPVRR